MPQTRFDVYAEHCPSREVLNLVTSRWTPLIIVALAAGPTRFGDLRRRLSGVSQKVLTEKLRELERLGLVTRTVIEQPLAVEYALTDIGHGLLEPLHALHVWAEEHASLAHSALETA